MKMSEFELFKILIKALQSNNKTLSFLKEAESFINKPNSLIESAIFFNEKMILELLNLIDDHKKETARQFEKAGR